MGVPEIGRMFPTSRIVESSHLRALISDPSASWFLSVESSPVSWYMLNMVPTD